MLVMFMQATAGLRQLGIDASDRILQAVSLVCLLIISLLLCRILLLVLVLLLFHT